MINFEQNRFFKGHGIDSWMAQKVIDKIPLAESLFVGKPGDGSQDPHLMCHEFGHAMELIQAGKHDRILVNNYGWQRFHDGKWSVKMAEAESKVFVFQWLLEEYFEFTSDGVLTLRFVPEWLAHNVNDTKMRNHFHSICVKGMEEQRPIFVALLNETVQFMVKSFDFSQQTV